MTVKNGAADSENAIPELPGLKRQTTTMVKNAVLVLVEAAPQMANALVALAVGAPGEKNGARPSLGAIGLYFSLMKEPIFAIAQRELARRESDNPFDEAFAEIKDPRKIQRIKDVIEAAMEMKVEEMSDADVLALRDRVVTRLNRVAEQPATDAGAKDGKAASP